MSDEGFEDQNPATLSARQRSQLIARALSDAARRARFSTRGGRNFRGGGFQARRGQKLMRIWFIASFIALVAIPILVTTVYFGVIASKQYSSEARFTLRVGAPPKMDSLGSLTGLPSMEMAQDTYIVINYIQSRAIIEDIERKLDLHAIYSRPGSDWYYRFNPKKPIEKFVSYWKSMIDVSVQMPGGIVLVTVRAFSPQDALKVADAVVSESEKLVNDMNDRIRHDALALSEGELQRSRAQLTKARIALEQARNDEGMLSAQATADAISTLITTARGDLLKLQEEFETQKHYVSETAPQMLNLRTRISAVADQITLLQSELTQPNAGDSATRVLSGTMTKMDYLELDRQIAQKIYETALGSYERTRVISEAKLMYVNTFVHPVLAQQSNYPRRFLYIGIVIAGSLLIWSALTGLIVLARNHMA